MVRCWALQRAGAPGAEAACAAAAEAGKRAKGGRKPPKRQSQGPFPVNKDGTPDLAALLGGSLAKEAERRKREAAARDAGI